MKRLRLLHRGDADFVKLELYEFLDKSKLGHALRLPVSLEIQE